MRHGRWLDNRIGMRISLCVCPVFWGPIMGYVLLLPVLSYQYRIPNIAKKYPVLHNVCVPIVHSFSLNASCSPANK